MAEILLTAEKYFPTLEKLGLKFVKTVEWEDGVQQSVFETPKGRRFLCPGVWGLPDELPMIPQRILGGIIKAAEKTIAAENSSPRSS